MSKDVVIMVEAFIDVLKAAQENQNDYDLGNAIRKIIAEYNEMIK